jgi:hypothetical protein
MIHWRVWMQATGTFISLYSQLLNDFANFCVIMTRLRSAGEL